MPFCHIHGVPQHIDPYGNATCERCERAAKADLALRCRECYAPIATPGLCPSCDQVAGRRRLYEWLGANAGWLTVLVLIAGLAVSFSVFNRTFLPSAADVRNSAAYNIQGRLEGTVRNARTGQPVAGASISLSTGERATTDSRGYYRIENLEVGSRCEVTADAAGAIVERRWVTIGDLKKGSGTTASFSLRSDQQP